MTIAGIEGITCKLEPGDLSSPEKALIAWLRAPRIDGPGMITVIAELNQWPSLDGRPVDGTKIATVRQGEPVDDEAEPLYDVEVRQGDTPDDWTVHAVPVPSKHD